MNNMTDDDLFKLGTELHEDPTWDGGWMRGGRPVTNLEMEASISVRRRVVHAATEARKQYGCCGHASECYRQDGADVTVDISGQEWTQEWTLYWCPITHERCERRMASDLIQAFGFLNRKAESRE